MPSQPSCPYGGQFHICLNMTTPFVGCCTEKIPACSNDNGCQVGDLFPMSWIADDYSDDLSQSCDSGSVWYICSEEHLQHKSPSPFMGCCKSNPCIEGCPTGDLTQAFLTNKTVHHFLSVIGLSAPSTASPRPSSSSSSSSSSSPTNIGFDEETPVYSSAPTATTAGHSALLTGTPASKSTNTPASITADTFHSTSTNTTNPKSNSTAIAGGVTGGIVGLALLVGLLAICCRRRNARPQHTVEGRSSALGSGQPRSLQADSAELEEMKQGPTPSRWSFLYKHEYG